MSQSAALLRAELKQISSVFPKNHATFRVVNATVDEISCHFVTSNGKHRINCTIPVLVSLTGISLN